MGNVITRICNGCVLHGLFPKELSISKVKYLFKYGNRKLVENYRPISILPSFSKIIERVVCLQLIHYLDTRSMLSTAQFGFRKNYLLNYNVKMQFNISIQILRWEIIPWGFLLI